MLSQRHSRSKKKKKCTLYLFVNGLLIVGGLDRRAVGVAVALAEPWRGRARVVQVVRRVEERRRARVVLILFARLAARQCGRVLSGRRRYRLAALYQLDDLVGLARQVAVRPERIVPAAVRAGMSL